MTSDRGWKKHFLSSGVPLEHEVGRFLNSQEISWDADFTFSRPSNGQQTESSVDISAMKFESFGNTEIAYKISLLIECKYRSQNKKIILLPLTNDHAGGAGYTLSCMDDFSHFHLRSDQCSDFESNFAFAYKAIEVFEGGAIEREFRHGIEQLRYAAPVQLRREIDFQLGSHMDDVLPVFSAKILVTNTEMRILKSDVSLSVMESASSLDEISEETDVCIYYSDYSDDYREYVKDLFKVNSDSRENSASFHADQLDMSGKELSKYSNPVRLVHALAKGDGRQCAHLGTQFFITNLRGLPKLIAGIRQTCKSTYRRRTRTDTFMKGLRKTVAGIKER